MDRNKILYNGILLLNKRPNITSHAAVSEVRGIIRQRRVGHTGTLDPKAEGLVVVCIGKATKIVQFISDFDKAYEAEIYLGKTSNTFDSEGTITNSMPKSAPDKFNDEMQNVLNSFTGKILQKVPAHSAVRVNGQRLYESARAGHEVELPIREVEIMSIELLSYEKPILKIKVTCSKGTYIRSLANDIGSKLECGGYLFSLKRTNVGNLQLEGAMDIRDVEELHNRGKLSQQLLSFVDVLNYSGILVSDEFKNRVLDGLDLKATDITGTTGEFTIGDRVLLKDKFGNPLAIGRAEIDSSQIMQAQKDKIFTYSRVLN
jgi:tRNA pseudouridine55 synthase